MNNQTQTLLHECLVSTGHVESCAAFRRKDVLLRANSNGFMVISGLAAIMNSGPMDFDLGAFSRRLT